MTYERTLSAMLTNLLERLAPHWPIEDPDGPDERTFWERVHDEDARRAENASTVFSTWRPDRGERAHWDLIHGFQVTHWNIGVGVESERANRFAEGHLFISLGLGPWALMLMRTSPRSTR